MLSRLAIRSRPSATDRVCKRLRRLVRRVISFRPRLSASLTKSFQTCIATLAQPLKYGRYVIIKCQGRPHASRHMMIDVLMSRPVMRFWAPERSDAGPAKGIDKSLLTLAAPRRYRSREHLRYVMQQPCLVCGRKPSDPYHLRYMQPRALGRKASDEFAVPLCRGQHRELHATSARGGSTPPLTRSRLPARKETHAMGERRSRREAVPRPNVAPVSSDPKTTKSAPPQRRGMKLAEEKCSRNVAM